LVWNPWDFTLSCRCRVRFVSCTACSTP
jgi:hypothetical protein